MPQWLEITLPTGERYEVRPETYEKQYRALGAKAVWKDGSPYQPGVKAGAKAAAKAKPKPKAKTKPEAEAEAAAPPAEPAAGPD